MANVFDLLKERSFIFQSSNEEGVKKALAKPLVVYQGFDPSADSLHLGHLLGLMALHHFQMAGHKVIFLVGGGTGKIGDPSGKMTSRLLLTPEVIANNSQSLKKQVEKIGLLTFSGENPAVLVNNDDWLSKFKFVDDFLMKIARHFSVNDLVKMRTFEERLQKEAPLSLLEFCYPALQAWDFLELYEKLNCTLQVGGQDQWANILAGVDLIRRKTEGTEVFALTFPLLTTADGVKMGKTEKGPVWLDSKKTSPYDFYQYLIKTSDEQVPQLLRLYTFLPIEEIDTIIKDKKDAQKRLAYEVTKLVHGKEQADKASQSESIPEIIVGRDGILLVEALVKSGCLPSNSEARRRIEQNAVSIDDITINDVKFVISKPGIVKYGKGGLLRIKI